MKNLPTIGQEVIRTKGTHEVGDIGTVIAVENNRARVQWARFKTWIMVESLEPTSEPYVLIKNGKWPKYHKL